ncbi:DNA cytosine methyltransferase [Sphingomonas changbaiensis]|uniref:DNA cytosine methyltransferase n=1 Tax=Sphingomonas changbaiensis TaxID=529705 RepID=UPI0009FF1E74
MALKVPTFIDLFAGCGGLSLGLIRAGFVCNFAVEAHADAFSTYRANLIDGEIRAHSWPDWLEVGPHDVVAIARDHKAHLASLRGAVDLIAGGPPCQGFSTNGRRNPDDPRSRMVDAYLDIVELVQPPLVLIENVRGFTSMPHADGGSYSDAVKRRLGALGYDAWADVFLASDFGVPQRRPRYICIAARKGSIPGINPLARLRASRLRFLREKGLGIEPVTTREALSDLALDGQQPIADREWGHLGFGAVSRHDDRTLTQYQQIMRAGCNGQPSDCRIPRHSASTRSRMREILDTCRAGRNITPTDRKRLGMGKRTTTLLDADAPSPTVTTLPDDFIHYSDARTMSVRELARLQSFPDWFSFRGPYTSGGPRRQVACPRYTQVGNAVPPMLAEAIGDMLRRLLRDQQVPERADIPVVREKFGAIALKVAAS